MLNKSHTEEKQTYKQHHSQFNFNYLWAKLQRQPTETFNIIIDAWKLLETQSILQQILTLSLWAAISADVFRQLNSF